MEARFLDELQDRYGLERTAAALAERLDREGQPFAVWLGVGVLRFAVAPGGPDRASPTAPPLRVPASNDLVRSKCRPPVKQIRQRFDVEALKKAA
jgi:hypothetical protein